jgi:hypothetical protein
MGCFPARKRPMASMCSYCIDNIVRGPAFGAGSLVSAAARDDALLVDGGAVGQEWIWERVDHACANTKWLKVGGAKRC